MTLPPIQASQGNTPASSASAMRLSPTSPRGFPQVTPCGICSVRLSARQSLLDGARQEADASRALTRSLPAFLESFGAIERGRGALSLCVAEAHRPNGTCLALSTSPARQAFHAEIDVMADSTK